jgi:hypothetical protein
MKDETTIAGLLKKREELKRENAELRERMAVIANDIEAIDRVLDASATPASLTVTRLAKPALSCSIETNFASICLPSFGKPRSRYQAGHWPVSFASARGRTRATGACLLMLRDGLDARCERCERQESYKAIGLEARRFGRLK